MAPPNQESLDYHPSHPAVFHAIYKEIGAPSVNEETLSKEQRILRVLRKVLANIVKDATPAPGMPHPLTESTVHDIRDLFGLISEREAELAEEAGKQINEKPEYAGSPKKTNVVKLHKPKKNSDSAEK